MDKTIFPAWERTFPREKALFEAWERQIEEMAGLGTALPTLAPVPSQRRGLSPRGSNVHRRVQRFPIG